MEQDEISLKELIIILIDGWKWIVSFTLSASLLALFFTLATRPVVYESTAVVNITFPVAIETQFGSYTFSVDTPTRFSSLYKSESVLQEISEHFEDASYQLTTSFDEKTHLLQTSVTASRPELSKDIHEYWLVSAQEAINTYSSDLMVAYFADYLNQGVNTLQGKQAELSAQLENVNNYINELDTKLTVSSIDNPENFAYSYALEKKAQLELEMVTNQASMNVYTAKMDVLKDLDADYDFVDLKVFVISPENVSLPLEASDRGIVLNTSIGFVLGGMLGVFVVFMMHYWKTEV